LPTAVATAAVPTTATTITTATGATTSPSACPHRKKRNQS
jgi:hypothetical protein